MNPEPSRWSQPQSDSPLRPADAGRESHVVGHWSLVFMKLRGCCKQTACEVGFAFLGLRVWRLPVYEVT